MSFLLRRNQDRAWAGWYDTFNRAPQNPIQQPWQHFGNQGGGEINSLEELHIINSGPIETAGGVSYEFEPFTGNYGFEAEIWAPFGGYPGGALYLFIMKNWAKNVGNPIFSQVTSIEVSSTSLSGDRLQITQTPALGAAVTVLASVTPPYVSGAYFTLKVLVEDDSWVRVYFNGIFMCDAMLSGTYKTGPGRRGLNLMCELMDAWVTWMRWYDRQPTVPKAVLWDVLITDTFNRADGPVDNGWTQLGANAGIVANSWSTTGTTNASKAILRDAGVTNGRQRVEGIVGGNIGISSNADSSLVLCSNSAGTQGLSANIFQGAVYISRFSSSLSGSTVTWNDLTARLNGVTIVNGDVISFSVYDGVAWVEQNGTLLLAADIGVHAVVPASNSYMGARVERQSNNNSNSWNSVRLMASA